MNYSFEHKSYLKKKRYNKYFVVGMQLAIVIIFIISWQYLSDHNILNPFIFSSPKKVLATIINLYQTNNLFNHIFITIYETLISFILGTLIGIVIAIILWYNNTIYKICDPYLTILNSLPKVALGPIIIIICGATTSSIILMALLISVIITIITVYTGFINTSKNRIKLVESLNATKHQMLKYVVIPSSYKIIISSLKINVSMSLIGVIMGEFLVSKEGIGYLITYGSQVFNLNLVIAGIVILMIVSYLMYISVSYLEKKLIGHYH